MERLRAKYYYDPRIIVGRDIHTTNLSFEKIQAK